MDIVKYYTEVSKEEIFKVKEIKENSDELNSELKRVTNLIINRSLIEKLIHPVITIKSNIEYNHLKKIKRNFDSFVESDALIYVDEELGDIVSDLECAARYNKPKMLREYIKTMPINKRNNKQRKK